MRTNVLSRIIGLSLVLALLAVDGSARLPMAGPAPAEAAGPVPNAVLGLFRTIGGLRRRNRVYREAGSTAAEINEYYDTLIAKAQSTRSDLIEEAASGRTPARFVRSYVRIEAALEAERKAAIEMIEGEKNQARRDFERQLGRDIVNALIASPGGQKIIGRIRDTIGSTREAAEAVQAAVEGGRPIDALGDALARQVGDIPILQDVSRELGSMAGQRLDRMLGGVLSKVEGAIDNMQGGMGDALEVLDNLDAEVARLQERERSPVSLVEGSSLVGQILPVDRANAAIDVAASAYAGAAEINGALNPGTTREGMRDRVRGALLDERVSGIRGLVLGKGAGETYCTAVGRGEYENAASQLGDEPEIAADPERAVYLVCYNIQAQVPVFARMTEPDGEEPTPTPQEEDGSDSPGSSGGMPAGSYRTTFEHISVEYLLSEITSQRITVTLAEDGTVTGTVDYVIHQYYTVPGAEGCIEEANKAVTGSLSGQVERQEGTPVYYEGSLAFNGITTIQVLASCGLQAGGQSVLSGSGQIRFVHGGTMTGQIDDLFRFEGAR